MLGSERFPTSEADFQVLSHAYLLVFTQSTFVCSKLTAETPLHCVKSVQSQ